MDYLHPQSFYDDRYDLHTIEECLDYYWGVKKKMEASRGELKDMTDEEFKSDINKALSYMINALKITRFRYRKERIREWIDTDTKMQELIDTAKPPKSVRCKECSSEAQLMSKDLLDAYGKNPYVLFMFECTRCHKRQALYADGREWRHERPRCPKCHAPIESDMKYKKDVLTTTSTCTSCSYTNIDVDDFAKSRKEQEEKERRDKELLAKYRSEFCYSEKDGEDAVRSMDTLVRVVDEIKAKQKKEADLVYQQAMKLKKISIVEMEKLVVDAITPQKYIRFTMGQPVIGKFVEVPFTAQDTDNSRKEYDSQNELKKLIIKALEGTNWRLMSDGIRGRLGVLSGRLKGLEQEDDLVQSIKEK